MESVLIKVGGALLSEPGILDSFWQSVARLRQSAQVVIVHGGGPQATELARKLGHEPRIVQGRRVTSDLDLDIIKWTLRGALNTRLVSQARSYGINSVGLSGVDGGILQVEKRPPWSIDGEDVDFGWVGDIQRIDDSLLKTLLEGGFLPIIAPLGIDTAGNIYNVNADTVALEIAAELKVSRFLMVAESGGVRKSLSDEGSHLTSVDSHMIERGKAGGWVQGGMTVKLDIALKAVNYGIAEVYICGPDHIDAPEEGTRVKM